MPRWIIGAVAGVVLGGLSAMIVGQAAAEPTQVTKIRGKALVVYKEATGAPTKRIPSADIGTPFAIKSGPTNGRYQVEINGATWWIPKAQAVTDEKIAGPAVSCQSLTKSYASSRGFADCKE